MTTPPANTIISADTITTYDDGQHVTRVQATPEQIEVWRALLLETLVPVVKQRVIDTQIQLRLPQTSVL